MSMLIIGNVMFEAFQMTEENRLNNSEWPLWAHKAWNFERETLGSLYPTIENTSDGTLSVGTIEGNKEIMFGDWICRYLETGNLDVYKLR